MEQWQKSDKTAIEALDLRNQAAYKTAIEALDLRNQAAYKVGPQHWPHGENAVREMLSFSAIFCTVSSLDK